MQVATVASAGDMAPQLRRCFSHEVVVAAPDQGQRRMLLEALLGGGGRALIPAALDNAAAQSAGERPPAPCGVVGASLIVAEAQRG